MQIVAAVIAKVMSRTVVWTFLESPLIPVETSNRHSGEKAVVVAVRVPEDITWKVNVNGSPGLWSRPPALGRSAQPGSARRPRECGP